jgi:hypothetical protein
MNPCHALPLYGQKPAEDHEQHESGMNQNDQIGKQ